MLCYILTMSHISDMVEKALLGKVLVFEYRKSYIIANLLNDPNVE